MARDILKERGRAFEAHYFLEHNEKLIEKLRERAHLHEVAEALAEKLRAEDEDLLQRAAGLGVTQDTAAAFLLAPLLKVAWADGDTSDREWEELFVIAEARGVAPGSPAQDQIHAWLRVRPEEALFDTAVDAIRAALSVLSPEEAEERIATVLRSCERVAKASGGGLKRKLGLASGISTEEAAAIEALARQLRAPRPE